MVVEGWFDFIVGFYFVFGVGVLVGLGGSKFGVYEKVNLLVLRGIISYFLEMRDFGWKCGFRLVVGEVFELSIGVKVSVSVLLLNIVACVLDMFFYLIMGLMFFVFYLVFIYVCSSLLGLGDRDLVLFF